MDPYWIVQDCLTLGFMVLGTWYIISALWHYSQFYRNGIPGPLPFPFFGTFGYMLYHGFSKYQSSNYQRFKNYKVYGIFDGSQPMLVIRDLDIMKEICVKNFSSFVNRRSFAVQPPADHMLTMLKDDHWKNVRSKMSPAFSSGKVRRMYPSIAQSARNLVKRLKQGAEGSELVELKEAVSCFSMDVIASVGFGVEVNSHQNEKSHVTDSLREMLSNSGLVIVITFLFPWLLTLCNFLRVNLIPLKTLKFFSSFVDSVLESRKEEKATGKSSNRNDFLQLMMEAQDDESEANNDNMSKDEAKALSTSTKTKPLTHLDYQGSALIFCLGAYDTVSSLMAFTLFLLAVHPEHCQRAQEEIDEVLAEKSLPTVEDVLELTYLDMCINEAVRLYPPGVLLDRICNEEISIQGVKIPKGMGVAFPVFAIHHDPDLWPDPETFDPLRFSPENKTGRHPCAHMLFGQGPRNCIAMRLAQLEVKVGLAGILHTLTPTRCEKTVYPVQLAKLQLKAEDGLWVRMEPR